MSKNVFLSGRISESGELELDTTRKRDQLAQLCGPVLIEVTKPTRRLRQLRYYWKLCEIVGDIQGESKDDIHDINKLNCNKRTSFVVNVDTGEITDTTYGGSTRGMPIDVFAAYTDRVIRFWAAQGINLLSPQEYFDALLKEEEAA